MLASIVLVATISGLITAVIAYYREARDAESMNVTLMNEQMDMVFKKDKELQLLRESRKEIAEQNKKLMQQVKSYKAHKCQMPKSKLIGS